ncbi:MAG: hypothetical protein FJ292_05540 [Planctomycetes bacterium]|nr:hypothetical protein [Planctomycetota bacterium]
MPLGPEALLRRLEAAGFTDEASDLRTSGSLEHVEAGESESEDGLPDRLGPFEIVGELGQGGYGVVLLGTQHRPVRRLAAVKLLKRGMDSRSVLARFRAEQQALGRADVRSDVWSLGVILGELLAGVRPLDREPARGADRRVDAGVFVRPSERFHRWTGLDASAAPRRAA